LLIPEKNEVDPIVQSHDVERENQLVSCILKNPLAGVLAGQFITTKYLKVASF
jgi:hypothetical protein